MREVKVRRATEQDADAIVRLWREMQDLHAEIEPMVWTTVADADVRARTHLGDLLGDPNRAVFVAVRGGEVVGYLVAAEVQRPPVLTPAAEGVIQECSVARHARRAGIGRLLVAEAMAWFGAQGLTMARTSCALENAASVPFWKAQGFRPYMVSGVRRVGVRADTTASGGDESRTTRPKTDYSQISEVYDAARSHDKPHVEWWLAKLAEAGGLRRGKRLLDLGCGTGRWTILLAERTGCHAVGVDRSPEMLEKARAKDKAGRVKWLLGDVLAPPAPPGSFDCALMSLMLHHLDEPLAAFRSALTALRPGGIFLIRQGTLEQTIDDPVHRFFPEAITVDRKRTPLCVEVENWLRQAGFEQVEAEAVRVRAYNSPREWLLEVEPRVYSVLRLIPDEAYARGLARMRAYIETHPDDPWLVENDMTLFTAHKRA